LERKTPYHIASNFSFRAQVSLFGLDLKYTLQILLVCTQDSGNLLTRKHVETYYLIWILTWRLLFLQVIKLNFAWVRWGYLLV